MTKLALVTGGARGIGAVVVAQLRAAGWDVLAPTRAECDWAEYESVWAWYLAQRAGSAYDSVIFNHGEWHSNIGAMPVDYERQYRMRVILPMMVLNGMLQGGAVRSVVMVASTQAFVGSAQTLPYACACAAQVRAMWGCAQSWPAVRFNTVAPGLTDTDLAQQVIATGDTKPGTVGQPPEAVAAVIVGLATDGASNGRVVRVVDSVAADAKWVWA